MAVARLAPRRLPEAKPEPEALDLAMIGGGYVGLVTAACLAGIGHRVTVVETDPHRLAELEAGRMPIHEPGLDRLVEENVRRRRLAFTGTAAAAVDAARAVFLAVGTPARTEDGRADLRFINEAVFEIAGRLRDDAVVVVKSTVPVGTCDGIEKLLRTLRPNTRIAVVSNPEFLRAGAAVGDFMHADRIVVGADDDRARRVMASIYRPLEAGGSPLVFVGRRSAEMTKYAANAFLATKITFINEVADFCEAADADVTEVARCIGLDRRIGQEFLRAGPGLGGSCFPKDTMALLRDGEDRGVSLDVVAAVCRQDRERKAAMADRMLVALGRAARGATVAVLGLTFKPDTDDLREAPALAIIPLLQAAGVRVRAYDPRGMAAARHLLPGVVFAADAYTCAEGADLLAVVTEWAVFRALDLQRLRTTMARPTVFDLRNIYEPETMARAGFTYHSLGRAPARPFAGPKVSDATESQVAAVRDSAEDGPQRRNAAAAGR